MMMERRLQQVRFMLAASLLLIIPIHIDLGLHVSAGPETKFRVLEYGVVLLGLLCIPTWLRMRTISWRLTTLSLWLMIAYWLIRSLVDPHREYALDTAFQEVSFLLFAALLPQVCPTPHQFYRLLRVVIPLQWFTLIYAAGQVYGVDLYVNTMLGLDWRWYNPNVGEDRGLIWAPLGNPNYYASYGALLLIGLITLFFLQEGKIWRTWIAGMIALLLYTLVYTFTRGIWISLLPTAALIGILVVVHLKRHAIGGIRLQLNRFRLVAGAGLLLLLAGSLYAWEAQRGGGPLHHLARRFYHGVTFRDTSMRSRPLMWHAALKMWRDAPVFGIGHGRFNAEYMEKVYDVAQEYDPFVVQQITQQMKTIRVDHAHNDYVQVLAEAGGVGFALHGLMMLALLGAAFGWLMRGQGSRRETILVMGCLAGIVQISLQTLYDFPLRLPASALWFSLFLGGVMVLCRESESVLWEWKMPAILRWGTGLVILALLATGGGMILRHYLASHELKLGRDRLEAYWTMREGNRIEALQRLREAPSLFRRADRLFPGDGEIQYEYGRALFFMYKEDFGTEYRTRAREQLQLARETYAIPELYQMLGTAYIEENRFAAARRYSEVLLVIDPRREGVQYLAGLIDYISSRFEPALAHLQEEEHNHPHQVLVSIYLGRTYEALQQEEAAAEAYQEALALDPNLVDPNIRLGDLYAGRLNQPLRARMHYQRAYELAGRLPESERVTWMKQVEIKLRDLQQQVDRMEGMGNAPPP